MEQRLIDVNELKEWVANWLKVDKYYHPHSRSKSIPITELHDILDRIPTVDAVPVVRCKECKYHEDEEIGMVYCPKQIGGWVKTDWFCADGERKDGETEQCNTYSLGKIEMPKGAMKKIIADGERKDGEMRTE